MNTLSSIGWSLLAGLCFSVTSCSGNNSANTDQSKMDTATSAARSTSSNVAPASSIITTPQNILLIMHKVANYEKWKMAYDAHNASRQSYGIHSYVVSRGVKDSNTVFVALRVDDTAKAMAFTKDPGLKEAMAKGGVMGTPTFDLITATYQDTSNIASKLRASGTFIVKDWDTWLQNFQKGAQERTDNGIIVRTYGHGAKDNHRVRVVSALVDSAKAMAYYQSDALKRRMDASGVISKPERFLYHIVQKY